MAAERTVLAALRQFLPLFNQQAQVLSKDQRRACWALTHCRTPALGGQAFACTPCRQTHFAWHSCNHKACPQCGGGATAAWIQREMAKRVQAPYFLVTFTLPAQLRSCFFGSFAKEAYDLFFTAVSRALSEKIATAKGFKAVTSGFTAALHTWNQQMGFHPHIHCLVPGAGLDENGRFVRVKQANFLVHLPHLQAAFRQHLRQLFDVHGWQVDPDAWNRDWGVHIKAVGSGAAAVKYLGTYVSRTAIHDARLVQVTQESVSFRWKNRDAGRVDVCTLPGVKFVQRYLQHVLPRGLRSVRYYGFCHPTAKAKRLRVQCHAGGPVQLGETSPAPAPLARPHSCPRCNHPMTFLRKIPSPYTQRGPPSPLPPFTQLTKA